MKSIFLFGGDLSLNVVGVNLVDLLSRTDSVDILHQQGLFKVSNILFVASLFCAGIVLISAILRRLFIAYLKIALRSSIKDTKAASNNHQRKSFTTPAHSQLEY